MTDLEAVEPNTEAAGEIRGRLRELAARRRSFRELLAALGFKASFDPGRNELRVRVVLAQELMPAAGNGTSALLSVPPGGSDLRTWLGNARLGARR